MSRFSPTKEQTWSQLQERLRRSRERSSPSQGSVSDHGRGVGRSRHGTAPPNPLPRIASPPHPESLRLTSPELRGSHFPRVPPLSTHRSLSDDSLSLDSFKSDSHHEPTLAPPQPQAAPHPYLASEPAHPARDTAQKRVPLWDQYTGRRAGNELRDTRESRKRGKKKNYARQRGADFEDDLEDVINANRLELAGRNHERYLDHGNGGEGPRFAEYDNVFGGREIIRLPAPQQNPGPYAYMQDGLFAATFMEYFLTSALQDDLILEVALDVLVQAREDQTIERQLSRPVLDVGGEILEEVVQESVRDVAYVELRASIKSFWTTALETPPLYKPVARDVLREVVDEEVSGLIPECISELVGEYFVQKDIVADFGIICDEVIVALLPEIILEAVYDESIVSIVQGFIQGEIVSLASHFLEEAFSTGNPRIPLSPRERSHDQEEVQLLADDFLLDAVIFENLLHTRLLPDNQVWSADEYLDLFMDSLLLDQVLGQQLEVTRRRNAMEHCLPLKRFHEKICTNVAIDVVMDELLGHLDEDMAEVDEYEVQMDRTAEYKPP